MATKTKTRKTYAKRTPEQREAEAKLAHDRLAEQVEVLTTSEGWKAYLRSAARFRQYSLSNVLLILAQNPEATQVAGYKTWIANGRQVRKGEKAIKIFGFRTYKEEDEATGEEIEKVYYPLVSVFDISQTDPIEGATVVESPTKLLEGEDEQGIGDRVAAYLTAKGWDVADEHIGGGVNGYTQPDGKKVRVRDDVSPAQRAKTLIHEGAHIECDHIADMGEYRQHRGRMECEAEGTAYVVADAVGIDTSAYSVGYVAGWADGDLEVVKETAEAVLKASKVILAGITDEK